MGAQTSIAGAALAALIVGACSPAAAGTTASPAPSAATPSPATGIVCDEETTGCAGPLTAGEHRTANFDHPFSFTVDDGWRNGRDIYRAYTLWSNRVPDEEFIVWSHAAPAMQTPDCGPARRPGYGTSVAEWLRSLNSDDRLDVSKPETFQLGQHAATRVKVGPKPTFKEMCPFNSDPFAVIVTDTENPPTRHHGGGGSMTFVDFGDDAIVIWNDGQFMVDTVSLPVIKSIQFQG
jgi:hypothetical protein